MESFNVKIVRENFFSKTLYVDNAEKEGEIKSYSGLIALIMKCLGLIKDAKNESTNKVVHLNKTQCSKLRKKNTEKSSFDNSQVEQIKEEVKSTPRGPKISSDSKSPLKAFEIYTSGAQEKLSDLGIAFTCNERVPDHILVDQEVLCNLPKGNYYTVHLTTDRLEGQVNHDKIKEFFQKNPQGVLIAFKNVTEPRWFKQVGRYESVENKLSLPVCTILFPATPETRKYNLETLKEFFKK